MNKSELIDAVAAAADISKAKAAQAVDGVTSAVTKALSKGDQVTLVGFGTFSVRERAARTGRNPRTGEEIKWKSKGYELSSEDKAKLQAEAAQKLQKREQAQKETYERTSEFLTEFFNKALCYTYNFIFYIGKYFQLSVFQEIVESITGETYDVAFNNFYGTYDLSDIKMNIDESTAIRSAFATASTVGLTKKKLMIC